MRRVLESLGVDTYVARWAPGVAELYQWWTEPVSFVELLLGLGFDWAEVAWPMRKAAEASPQLLAVVRDELRWGLPNSARSAVCIACRYVPSDLVIALYKQTFPQEAVLAKLLEHLCS